MTTGGGQTGDVRDRLVVDDTPYPQADLEPRAQRAVDGIGESYTCPDWQQE